MDKVVFVNIQRGEELYGQVVKPVMYIIVLGHDEEYFFPSIKCVGDYNVDPHPLNKDGRSGRSTPYCRNSAYLHYCDPRSVLLIVYIWTGIQAPD